MVASPVVGELLIAARRCKILVTSREILRVYGEHDYAVPPLAIPDLGQRPTLEQLRECAAVALFIQRAQAVKTSFELTPDNARAVADICVRLDGLPLAIELAAAHIRLFTPQEMLPRLANRLALLTGGSKDLSARQQTLRGAINWSYELLDLGERRLFARLGVFVGGCTIGAAETVCNADGDVQPGVPTVLASLVDKSLLQPRKGDESSFIMLETLRDYALEMLVEAGEAARVWRRHAEYYVQLAEAAEPELRDLASPSGSIVWSASTTTCARRWDGPCSRGRRTRRCDWAAHYPISGIGIAI
jgi:predicted ATPase